MPDYKLKCKCGREWRQFAHISELPVKCECGKEAEIQIEGAPMVGGFREPMVLKDLDSEKDVVCNSAKEVDRECNARGVNFLKMRKRKEKIYVG